MPAPMPSAMPPPPAAAPTMCPRCSSPALPGFAFCPQCGFRLGPPSQPGLAPAPPPGVPIDAQGATLAATGADALALRAAMPAPAAPRPAPAAVPAAQASPSWGVAVSVNRDGSDGERFPLGGEFVLVGRADADIVFEQDRFLARHHARIERTSDGCRVIPMDTLNGVFRKIDSPVELANGTTVLVGREVLRFEKVDADEKTPDPLVRHGVALFGSPPREPWGRLLQMVPSGGVRDIRYLSDDEITLGREEGDLVYSDDAFLSRRHCTIGWDGTRAVITDLGSSNGTFVRLSGPLAIKHGEHVRMGDQLFRIELRR
jgi:pSer/pThr/pTyr-binding forkhead associated (FHA) protein